MTEVKKLKITNKRDNVILLKSILYDKVNKSSKRRDFFFQSYISLILTLS